METLTPARVALQSAVERLVGRSLRKVMLVEWGNASTGSHPCYLGLGMHRLYLVEQTIQKILLQVRYAQLKPGTGVRPSSEVDGEMIITLRDDARAEKGELAELVREQANQIALRAVSHARVIRIIAMYVKTDYMFRSWRVPPHSVLEEVPSTPDASARGDAYWGAVAKLPAEMSEVSSFCGYRFFYPEQFRLRVDVQTDSPQERTLIIPAAIHATASGAAAKLPHGYAPSDFDGAYIKVYCLAEVPLQTLRHRGMVEVKDVADAVVEKIATLVTDYRFVKTTRRHCPRQYFKKMNLVGDPAQWEAWEIHIRTWSAIDPSDAMARRSAERDIGIIVLRRKYLPPLLDTAQDFVFIQYAPTHDWQRGDVVSTRSSKEFLDVLEAMVDSVMPTTRVDWDRNVADARCNALLHDDAGYLWHQSRLRIVPRWFAGTTQALPRFVAALQRCIFQTDIRVRRPEGDVPIAVEDNPFDVVEEIMRQDRGKLDPSREMNRMFWEHRVWAYLAYTVSGQLMMPGGFAVLCDQILQMKMQDGGRRTLKVAERVIAQMLHLRRRGEVYVWKPMAEKIKDARIMAGGQMRFNERVMIELLEHHYARKAMLHGETDRALFPTLLIRLAQHCTATPQAELVTKRLQFALGKEFFRISQDLGTDVDLNETTRTILLPGMIDLLRHSRDDNLRVQLVVSMANFAVKRDELRREMMQRGVVSIVIGFLTSKNPDLLRNTCLLLNNCSCTAYGRRIVAAQGAIGPLMQIIAGSPLPPHHHHLHLILQAVSVLRNLAADVRDGGSGYLRDKIVESLKDDQANSFFWLKWGDMRDRENGKKATRAQNDAIVRSVAEGSNDPTGKRARESQESKASGMPRSIFAVMQLLFPEDMPQQFADAQRLRHSSVTRELKRTALQLLTYMAYNHTANKSHIGMLISFSDGNEAILSRLLKIIIEYRGGQSQTCVVWMRSFSVSRFLHSPHSFFHNIRYEDTADGAGHAIASLGLPIMSIIYVLSFTSDNFTRFFRGKAERTLELERNLKIIIESVTKTKFSDDSLKQKLIQLALLVLKNKTQRDEEKLHSGSGGVRGGGGGGGGGDRAFLLDTTER